MKNTSTIAALAAAAVATLLAGCTPPDSLAHYEETAKNAFTNALNGGAGVASGPYYTQISGGTEINGLFARDGSSFEAQYGELAWPRASIEVLTSGASQVCWTMRAVIWHSPKQSHVETFNLCDAPVPLNGGFVDRQSLLTLQQDLEAALVRPNIKNTDAHATVGPLPPRTPFDLVPGDNAYVQRWNDLEARLAYLTGYRGKGDYRLWLYRIDGHFND